HRALRVGPRAEPDHRGDGGRRPPAHVLPDVLRGPRDRAPDQRLPQRPRNLPRPAAVLHDRDAQVGERRVQPGRRVLLPARGHQDAGGAAMAVSQTEQAADARLVPPSYGAWLLPGYLLSLALVFVGERIVSSDAVRYACSGLGVLGALGTTGVRFARSGAGQGERGRAERVL